MGGSQSRSWHLGKKDISLAHTVPPPWESNHDSSVVQAVTQLLCRLRYPCLQFFLLRGTRWRNWLRHCATSRKDAGSIPDGVIGIFH